MPYQNAAQPAQAVQGLNMDQFGNNANPSAMALQTFVQGRPQGQLSRGGASSSLPSSQFAGISARGGPSGQFARNTGMAGSIDVGQSNGLAFPASQAQYASDTGGYPDIGSLAGFDQNLMAFASPQGAGQNMMAFASPQGAEQTGLSMPGAPQQLPDDIQNMAMQKLGRNLPPDAIKNLQDRNMTSQQILDHLSQSPEGTRFATRNKEKLQSLGMELYGRNLRPGELSRYQNMPLDQARAAILESEEGQGFARRNPARMKDRENKIQAISQKIHGRQLSPKAIAFEVASGASLDEIQAKFSSGPEGEKVYQKKISSAPPTGLIGFEEASEEGLGLSTDAITGSTEAAITALREGQTGGLGSIDEGGVLTGEYIERGAEGFTPYTEGGAQSQQVQLALSGALGPEAQAEAYANFQSSPGQDFLRDQAEQALLRGASATGGLGGGAIQSALQQQAMGMAQQDFGNYYDRLGGLSDRGLQASTSRGQLLGMGADFANTRGGQKADIYGNTAQNIAATETALGGAASGLYERAYRDKAASRYDTGARMQDRLDRTTSALANLQTTQGAQGLQALQTQADKIGGLMESMGMNLAADYQTMVDQLTSIGISENSQLGKIILSRGAKSDASSSSMSVGAKVGIG
jgi:hypothetical protein